MMPLFDWAPPLPEGPFSVVYSDPPWHWKSWSAKNQTRAAANHYPIMTLGDVKALPVQSVVAEDCVLFLWAINSMLPQALEVIAAWGFKFKTVGFCWAKLLPRSIPKWHTGLGYWTRQNTESCLLATRGHPKRVSRSVRQLVVAPRREHSRKPDEVYEAIEALVPGPYIELFARTTRPGWQSWGLETDRFLPKNCTEVVAA